MTAEVARLRTEIAAVRLIIEPGAGESTSFSPVAAVPAPTVPARAITLAPAVTSGAEAALPWEIKDDPQPWLVRTPA